MKDPFEGLRARSPLDALRVERKVFAVSELTRSLRAVIESRFPNVWVRGEISNLTRHASGHWYFTLKDKDAQLRATMFRADNLRVRFRVDDGQSVVCRGRLSVYDKRGDYQLLVEEVEPLGAGALQLAFEQLKQKLDAEGLFRLERKRKLPMRPRRVGIVTSPTGAAIQDLLQVIGRRDPSMSVLLCPTRVQGEGAAQEIVAALRTLGASSLVDVIICGRGGGSLEDLWCFNEERVARAIAACPVPVVSAVGHEVDFTIADFVADMRAPTPSAAAELVVPVRDELRTSVMALRDRLRRATVRRVTEARHGLARVRGALTDPRHLLARHRLALDDAEHRSAAAIRGVAQRSRRRLTHLGAAVQQHHPAARLTRGGAQLRALRSTLAHVLERPLSTRRAALRASDAALEAAVLRPMATRRERLAGLIGKLDALSPLASLGRGYAIVRRARGSVVRSATDVKQGEKLEILLAEGRLQVRVLGGDARPQPPSRAGGAVSQGAFSFGVGAAAGGDATRDDES